MSRFLFSYIFLFAVTFFSFGQKQVKSYEFKIDKLENIAQAKEFTEATRGLFDCIPNFNEKDNSFYYSSSTIFFEKEINEKINQFGYTLVYFKEILRE